MDNISILSQEIPSYLKSPLIVYSCRYPENRYHLLEVTNSIGEVFHLAKQNREKIFLDINKDIEVAKYPLLETEITQLFDRIRLQSAVQGSKYRMQYREADELFKSVGIYYRLGILQLSDSDRYAILKAYSRLYHFCFRLNDWTTLELKEFQRLADLGYSYVDISKFLNRSYDDLVKGAKQYGIVLARKKRGYQAWTDEEYNILREYVGLLSFSEIKARHLPHRNVRSLIMAASKIGLSARGKRNGM